MCQASAAMQPTFAFSSANSNTLVFGGNVQSSVANSAVASVPWNVQVVCHFCMRVNKSMLYLASISCDFNGGLCVTCAFMLLGRKVLHPVPLYIVSLLLYNSLSESHRKFTMMCNLLRHFDVKDQSHEASQSLCIIIIVFLFATRLHLLCLMHTLGSVCKTILLSNCVKVLSTHHYQNMYELWLLPFAIVIAYSMLKWFNIV